MSNYKNRREEIINNLILIMRNQILNDKNNLYTSKYDNISKQPVIKLSKLNIINYHQKKQKRKYFNYLHYTLYAFYNY